MSNIKMAAAVDAIHIKDNTMSDLPSPVHAYIGAMANARMPAYLQVDATHQLVEWGGWLSTYGITDLRRDQLIGEQIVFLEGLLPLEEPTLCLPWIETQPGCYADIHLFAMDDTVWILFLDATPEASQYQLMQQSVNTAALASQREKEGLVS